MKKVRKDGTLEGRKYVSKSGTENGTKNVP